ncbi:alpha/beta hydrolase [Stutzerimonas tarimensis]|uniref:Alpha/beta hydrolase n=1 Tax=Stutzerimonas tarimensis TaxID=1507735 RepID=A0ABV7T649_9GAMM
MKIGHLVTLWRSFSGIGLLLGTLFFAAALTPTLIPRSPVTQGILSGCAFAAGYGIGVFWRWLWRYMELREPPDDWRDAVNLGIALLCVVLTIIFLRQAVDWQNSIRSLMGLEPVMTGHPLQVCLIAALTFLALLALARLWRAVYRFVARRVRRFMPRRVANVVGVAVAVALFWAVTNDVLLRLALRGLDATFAQYDALIDPQAAQPASPLKGGSPASRLSWEELGRAGREFIISGPSADDIAAVSGREALEPIRIYVGLRAAETPEQRAELALEELIRTGAFRRSLLVIATPTGTGWVDPSAMDAVEYLHGGDIATVAMQYSYLNSPLSLLVEAEYGTDSARALFSRIYGHWSSLPKAQRPRLYLHGLSLGAMHSERSTSLYEMIGDPIDGALWSGPPYESRTWRAITEARNPGTPAWLPEFRDGSLVRFMNQDGFPAEADAPWGPMRIVFLQYASDPVTFFSYRYLYRRPDWMAEPRGPDVSPQLRWFPVVTMLQLALDMAVNSPAPMGHGHVYAPAHYLNGWVAVSDAPGWSPEGLERLRQHLTREVERAAEAEGHEAAYQNRGG